MVHSPVHWNPLNCARRRFDGWVSRKPTSIRGSVWTAQLTKETMRDKKGGRGIAASQEPRDALD